MGKRPETHFAESGSFAVRAAARQGTATAPEPFTERRKVSRLNRVLPLQRTRAMRISYRIFSANAALQSLEIQHVFLRFAPCLGKKSLGMRKTHKQGGTVEFSTSPLNFSGVKFFFCPATWKGVFYPWLTRTSIPLKTKSTAERTGTPAPTCWHRP